MKKVKNLLFIFFLAGIAISTVFYLKPSPCAQAADLWRMQQETGIEKIGSEAYGGSSPRDVRIIVASLVKVFIEFLGIIFLVLIVWGGYKYMLSRGESEKVDEALKMIRNGVIGLVIIVASWTIAVYITDCALDITSGWSTRWMCN